MPGPDRSPLRVALVFSRFHRQGGTERQVAMLADDLAARGHEVHVFTRLVRGPAPSGVTLHVMPRLPLGNLGELVAFSAWARRKVAAVERRDGPFDVRHAFGRTLGQDVYRLSGGCHKTYLDHAHALDRPAWLRRWLRRSPIQRVKLALESAALSRRPAPLVITNSRMVRDDLADRYGLPDERLVTIPNGVDLALFHPPSAAERAEVRAEWGFGEEHEVGLFIGSGFARKGLEPTLRALARLSSERPALRLVVQGKERRCSRWRRLARSLGLEDRVYWAGSTLSPERAYRGVDVVVLPSAYDAAANATAEALASGVPVVTSTMNGASELIEPRFGEVLASPVHPDELAAALARWLRPGDPAAVRDAARSRAEEHPIDQTCQRVLDAYQILLTSPGAPS